MTQWNLKGEYFEACNCDVACPCIFASPPPPGDCTVMLAYHIDKGRFGETPLDGLNTVVAAYSPGPMDKVKWRVAMYTDSRATREQSDAMNKTFMEKQAGGLFSPFVGEFFGTKSVKIDYEISGKERNLKIRGIADLKVQDVVGPNGRQSMIGNAPWLSEPLLYVARSRKLVYRDHGMNWNISGKNSYHSSISWKGS